MVCYIYRKKNYKLLAKNQNYSIIPGRYRGAAHNIFNLRFNVSNEIPAVFHNGSNYDYHFTIK